MRNNRVFGKATFVLLAAGLISGPLIAHHQWSTYSWSTDGVEPIAFAIVDNTDSRWTSYVSQAVADWNASPHINASLEFGNNSDCTMVTGTQQVCNDAYGETGWVGLNTIALSGDAITASTAKLNDTYFERDAYNTFSRRSLTTCHELGHGLGLGHQNEDFNTDATESCLEYTSAPEGNESPDAHDYEELALMYGYGTDTGGGDGGTDDGSGGGGKGNGKGKAGGNGGGKPDKGKGKSAKARVALASVGNTPAGWGRPTAFLPNGKPFQFKKQSGGYTYITYVKWADE